MGSKPRCTAQTVIDGVLYECDETEDHAGLHTDTRFEMLEDAFKIVTWAVDSSRCSPVSEDT